MSDIVARIIQGDAHATSEFYTQYAPKILSYLIRRLPRNEDAQEIMQDVFLEAIDSLMYFEKRSTTLSWLYKIAHNKVVDYYRKRKIKSVLFSTVPFLQIAAAEINEPEFQFEKDKIRDNIELAFFSLSKRYQQVLILRYEQGVSVKKIAIILNLSFKATESLLFRARQDFKKAYERA